MSLPARSEPRPAPKDRRRPRRLPSGRWFSAGLGLGLGALTAYLLVKAVLQLEGMLSLALLALLLAVSLDPLVVRLCRWGFRRRWAVLVVLVAVALATAATVGLFVPPVSAEVSALARQIPVWLQQLHDHHSALGRLEDRFHVVERARSALSGAGAGRVAGGLLGAGQVLLSTVTGLVLMLTLTVYFLAGLPVLKGFCLRLVPGSRRDRAAELTDEILGRTGRFMLANVATSILAGLATLVWLEIWGVPYPVALGVFVAVMDLVPIVGSTIGGIVVSLVALVVSWPAAIATAVFYIVFRLAEDYLITPKAMVLAVRVHPLVTILAVLAGGALLGITGAVLALPVAIAVGVLLEEVVFPRIQAR